MNYILFKYIEEGYVYTLQWKKWRIWGRFQLVKTC